MFTSPVLPRQAHTINVLKITYIHRVFTGAEAHNMAHIPKNSFGHFMHHGKSFALVGRALAVQDCLGIRLIAVTTVFLIQQA